MMNSREIRQLQAQSYEMSLLTVLVSTMLRISSKPFYSIVVALLGTSFLANLLEVRIHNQIN